MISKTISDSNVERIMRFEIELLFKCYHRPLLQVQFHNIVRCTDNKEKKKKKKKKKRRCLRRSTMFSFVFFLSVVLIGAAAHTVRGTVLFEWTDFKLSDGTLCPKEYCAIAGLKVSQIRRKCV
jgi:hypothetical protein